MNQNQASLKPLRIVLLLLIGMAIGLFGVWRDVHQVDLSNQQVLQTNKQYRAYIQNSPRIDPSLPVFAVQSPAPGYHIVAAVAEDGGYKIYYAPANSADPQLIISGARLPIPADCEATMSGRVKRDTNGTYYSCNIVLRTPAGNDVYGYRDLSYLKSQGVDPASLTPQKLRQIQPTKFYVVITGELITIDYSAVGGDIINPLTPTVIAGLVDTLRPLNEIQRANFINQYIRPQSARPTPVQPVLKKHSPTHVYAIIVLSSMYLAVFIAAAMQIFTKAGRSWWPLFVPVYGLWVLLDIASLPGWWSLIFLLPAPLSSSGLNLALSFGGASVIAFWGLLIAALLGCLIVVALGRALARKFGQSPLFALLLIIPPFPGYLILGLGDASYEDHDSTPSASSASQSPVSLAQ